MTIHSGSVYFLGKYRPLYVEGDTIEEVAAKLRSSIQRVKDAYLQRWLIQRIREGQDAMTRGSSSVSSWSADHYDRGVSFATRAHDPFLDKTTAAMAPCPGLDYSLCVNAFAEKV